jgi:hypothetical protein
MLKLRSKGLALNFVVNDLCRKYKVTPQCLYRDWRNRKSWLPDLLDYGDRETVFLDILARHEDIYKMTVREYLQGDNSSARVGALRLLRELNLDFYELSVSSDIMTRLERLEEEAAKHR